MSEQNSVEQYSSLDLNKYTSIPIKSKFKMLRTNLLNNFGDPKSSYLNMKMLLLLYIIYTNEHFRSLKNNVFKDYVCIGDYDGRTAKFCLNISNQPKLEKTFNRFVDVYKSNSNVMYATTDKLFFSKKNSIEIVRYFNRILKNESIDDTRYLDEIEEFEAGDSNSDIKENNPIKTVTEYLIDNNKTAISEIDNVDVIYIPNRFKDGRTNPIEDCAHYYIPNRNFNIYNLHSIMNRDEYLRFIMNPETPLRLYDNKIRNTIQNVDIELENRVYIKEDSGEKFVSKYVYYCSRCNDKIDILPINIYQKLKHACKGYTDINGKQKEHLLVQVNAL
jgi:hypothetical protein